MADDDFVPCLFFRGKECSSCANRVSTNSSVKEVLVETKKARKTFASLWRVEPAAGAFSNMMRSARPKAYSRCVYNLKQ